MLLDQVDLSLLDYLMQTFSQFILSPSKKKGKMVCNLIGDKFIEYV
jgi:hypothetical protein